MSCTGGRAVVERRWPAGVYGKGEEPDPRFSLANERTALAWIRTALALVGGGVAVISLSALGGIPGWVALAGAASCLGGGAVAVRAVIGWARTERALRERLPLPAPRALQWLAGGVVVFAGLAVVLAFVELRQP